MPRDWRTTPYILAECLECGKTWDGYGNTGKTARRSAIYHARKHNHKVRVESTVTFYYQDVDK